MLDFLINNLNNLLITGKCSVLGAEFHDILKEVFGWIQIAVPCLVLVLCSVDLASAVISQEEKNIQAALSKVVKRVMIGVAIFFVPTVIDFMLDLAGIASGVCKIGGV